VTVEKTNMMFTQIFFFGTTRGEVPHMILFRQGILDDNVLWYKNKIIRRECKIVHIR